MRRIKNREKLTKEELIITLLKSESRATEGNFEKIFNNNADDDDTYDGKMRGKIRDIRMIRSRLGNIVDINDRKKIKRELYEIENKKNLSNGKKNKLWN